MSKDEFDPSEYKTIEEIGKFQVDGKKDGIQAAIHQYKDGPLKLKVQRRGVKKDGEEYSRDLGGMTAEEAEAVAGFCKKGAERLRKLAK